MISYYINYMIQAPLYNLYDINVIYLTKAFLPRSNATSFSIPPYWRTVRRDGRNLATLAIVSADRHLSC